MPLAMAAAGKVAAVSMVWAAELEAWVEPAVAAEEVGQVEVTVAARAGSAGLVAATAVEVAEVVAAAAVVARVVVAAGPVGMRVTAAAAVEATARGGSVPAVRPGQLLGAAWLARVKFLHH